nr:uncharacterized protein LOC128698879 [Cherax quadricarinatus]
MKFLILSTLIFCLFLLLQEKVHGEKNVLNDGQERSVVDLHKTNRGADPDNNDGKLDRINRIKGDGRRHYSISDVIAGDDRDVEAGGEIRHQGKNFEKRRRNKSQQEAGRVKAAGKSRVQEDRNSNSAVNGEKHRWTKNRKDPSVKNRRKQPVNRKAVSVRGKKEKGRAKKWGKRRGEKVKKIMPSKMWKDAESRRKVNSKTVNMKEKRKSRRIIAPRKWE